ncbi:MAG: nucleotidyl transferase AbiEii/AbiGii toxin family protein, partial [Sulfuriflexus sp.]|nr:nucleotidyl transferase AbiEii/AbiGii toxin family protein [Sulfuriflexus sp.]
DREVAAAVASHKSHFFIEKDRDGQTIDYTVATTGHLKIVPEGDAKAALAQDYEAMLADEVMIGNALTFDALMNACANLEDQVNRAST